MLPIVYLNGEFVPKASATLHVSDLAILRGFGIFDFFRYVQGKPRFVEDHLNRFFRSADKIGLEMPVSKDELRAVVMELIKRNELDDGGIRFVLTGGYSENGYTPTTPNLIGMAYPFPPLPRELTDNGANILLHEYQRQFPTVKSIDYLEGIRIQPMLKERGADFVLYVDQQGYVRESDRSNYFIVVDGKLITPAADVLEGITRMHLLRLAQQLGLPTEERAIHRDELLAADELIICSSAKAALHARSVDGKLVGDGTAGPITRKLQAAWPAYYLAH
ncbi:aminotransferase class IV [Lewinella sp. W8]|uniref:aminotransferase class IV n=1 Tax=Lewinella sp. W8 TaxID=2528208 RepID=UPI0010677431|nr:aminotransferase class IV [Lewinella sp. W8]MTB51163.1 amino acid aminotransferase [Lewinella sp. W8]